MSDAIIVQLITTVGLVVVAVIGNRKLNRIGQDARTTAQQTANEHHDAPFPNLRDELTAVREGQEDLRVSVGRLADAQDATRQDVGGLHSEVRTVRNDITGMRTDARHDRREIAEVSARLDDAVRDRNNALEGLRREIPGVIATAVEGHVDSCPLRRPGDIPAHTPGGRT